MVHKIWILLMFLPSRMLAQQDTTLPRVLSSVKGEITGPAISREIGTEGGTISSEDGMVTLIFPVGALKRKTTISISPCQNTMPYGSGKAYRFEPSGTKFEKPVTIHSTYRNSERKGHTEGMQGLALQNEKGTWEDVRLTSVDTVKNILTGEIHHFSTAVIYEKLVIAPEEYWLKVGETAPYIALWISTNEDWDEASTLEEFSLLAQHIPIKGEVEWKANGIRNGNASVGTLRSNEKISQVTYKAPLSVPSENPVMISVEAIIDWAPTVVNQPRKVIATANAAIYNDAYLVSYTHRKWEGCFDFMDSSDCFVELTEHGAKIYNIRNHPFKADWDPCTNVCKVAYTNIGTCKGVVEIAGLMNAKLTPAPETNPFKIVHLELFPAFGGSPACRYECPKVPAIDVPSIPLPAEPRYIHFETDGDKIILEYGGIRGEREIVYRNKDEEFRFRIVRLN